jgi:hypothetical protein
MSILQYQIDKYESKPRRINACVYRLSYGDKFIIVKGKTLTGSMFVIQKGFGWFREEIVRADTLYVHFYRYIRDNPGKKFRVRVITKAANPYFLLKREQQELDRERYNPNMLNNRLESYIPAYNNVTEMYGWIPETCYRNYIKYFKSRKRKALLREYKRLSRLKPAKRGL